MKSHSKHDMASTMTSASAVTTAASGLSGNRIKTKIENATEGLPHNCFNCLHYKVLHEFKENALTICDYISSLKSEVNQSDRKNKTAC
jgi:hypothetical protein